MINEQIRDREVRLIGPDGAQLGIVSAREAMAKAQEAGLDLVKIAPRSSITVNTVTSLQEKKKRPEKSRKPSMSKKCVFPRTLIRMI